MSDLRLTMNTDNAAFTDDPGREVARILRQVADAAERGGFCLGDRLYALTDANGNRVGAADWEGDPYGSDRPETCHWKDYFPGAECDPDSADDPRDMGDSRDGAPYCDTHAMMRTEMLDAWELIHGYDPDEGAGWLPVCATCGFTLSEVGGGHVDAGAAAYCADIRGDEPIVAIDPEGTEL